MRVCFISIYKKSEQSVCLYGCSRESPPLRVPSPPKFGSCTPNLCESTVTWPEFSECSGTPLEWTTPRKSYRTTRRNVFRFIQMHARTDPMRTVPLIILANASGDRRSIADWSRSSCACVSLQILIALRRIRHTRSCIERYTWECQFIPKTERSARFGTRV